MALIGVEKSSVNCTFPDKSRHICPGRLLAIVRVEAIWLPDLSSSRKLTALVALSTLLVFPELRSGLLLARVNVAPRQSAPKPPLPASHPGDCRGPRVAAGLHDGERRRASSSTSRRSRAGPTRNTSSPTAAVSYTPKARRNPRSARSRWSPTPASSVDERLVSFSELQDHRVQLPHAPARPAADRSSRKSPRRCRSTRA